MMMIKEKSKIRKKARDNENVLALYLKEINRINLMTREEEKKYATLAARGDEESKAKLINANLRFVVNVAKHYQNQGLPLEDLISEGNIGLINAIEKFDVTKGYHFISYAVWWIRQSILKAICEKSRMIRLPMNRIYEISKIERMKEEIQDQKGLLAKIEEIAKKLNMDKDLVADLMNISREMVSLEVPVFEESDSSMLRDFVEDKVHKTPTDIAINSTLRDEINEIFKGLSKKEKKILEHRFGLNGEMPASLREIGNRFNLTKERIRQIEKRAIERIKENTEVDKLRAYLV